MTLGWGKKVKCHYISTTKSNFVCVLTNKRYKQIERNFHSVALVHVPGMGLGDARVKNLRMRICDGAPSTARSRYNYCYYNY